MEYNTAETNENQTQNECNFWSVDDPQDFKQLTELTHCKKNVTNMTFWKPVDEPDFWGLTLKSQKYKGKNSKPVWKITLCCINGAIKPSKATAHLQTTPITSEESNKIAEIYFKVTGSAAF